MKNPRKTKDLGKGDCQSDEKKDLHELLNKVGDKWSILLIVVLARSKGKRARFSELFRLVDGISQRMLTTVLRSLERDGFITREVFPEVPPRVEYTLSSLGESLLVPMEHIVEWVLKNRLKIRKARESYDVKKS